MENLTLEQLRTIPWNKKYLKNGEFPPEPDESEIHHLIGVPFLKRKDIYILFYTWYEIVKFCNGSNRNILDAACGRGQIAQILGLLGNRVEACDITEDFCAESENINFQRVDLNGKWPYEDNSFDVVINSTALHYLESSVHFFSEAKRVLKSGGKMVFSLPNIANIGGRIYFLKTGRITEFSSAVLSRRNFLYPDYIYALLQSLGFQIETIKGTAPSLTFKIRMFNLIFGRFLRGLGDEELKYSNTVIVSAVLKK